MNLTAVLDGFFPDLGVGTLNGGTFGGGIIFPKLTLKF